MNSLARFDDWRNRRSIYPSLGEILAALLTLWRWKSRETIGFALGAVAGLRVVA